jgi:hypothetical protein
VVDWIGAGVAAKRQKHAHAVSKTNDFVYCKQLFY